MSSESKERDEVGHPNLHRCTLLLWSSESPTMTTFSDDSEDLREIGEVCSSIDWDTKYASTDSWDYAFSGAHGVCVHDCNNYLFASLLDKIKKDFENQMISKNCQSVVDDIMRNMYTITPVKIHQQSIIVIIPNK
ncbi:unnamed protein product [Lactuca saligna]|uniref:Uncharacterized protein n=1 Tax=Lactuca saligna TaxID=75948 RepID=A0AA35YT86_LACSI|nr:unnamed protein product [Lactuca saligna]